MKKSVVALILLAVLIIIVSPGLIGKYAEDSVGENLNWAAQESGELIVSSEEFDRSWFSSEGQHRVELGDGQIRAALDLTGDSATPALLINTHIDHGLIAVSSLGRDKGSLTPALGKAVSTLSFDNGHGEITELPGTIYSNVELSGDLDSKYVVEAGSHAAEDGDVTWEASSVKLNASAKSGDFEFDGDIGAMTFGNDEEVVSISGMSFSGDQTATPHGYHVGDVEFVVGEMSLSAAGAPAGGVKGLNLSATSSLDDGALDTAVQFNADAISVPAFGDVSVDMDLKIGFADAAAVGRVTQRLEEMSGGDPTQLMMQAEEDFKDLFAAGMSFDADQIDVALPMGLVESELSIDIPASDRDTFEWTALLLSSAAELDVKVPESLVQMATSMNPDMGGIIAMGYLKKDGDSYVMDADFKKGLLTINGAPVPIPLGGF